MNLNTPLKKIIRITETQQKSLDKLGIKTVENLLYHFPNRYGDTTTLTNIENLIDGYNATVYGKLKNLQTGKTYSSKISKSTGILEDDTGEISITWFRQPYIAKMFKDGAFVKATGKIVKHKNKLTLNNPKIEQVSKIPIGVGNSLFGDIGREQTLYPVYPETKGVTSNWLYHANQKIFKTNILDNVNDPIPENILKKYKLPSLKTALIWIHSPKKEPDALAARKRFAFEEIFFIQLQKQFQRKENDSKKSFMINVDQTTIDTFISKFPFQLTNSQKKAINDITKDLSSNKPMSRLLEGDVGSGKTAVAATAIYATTVTPPKENEYGHLQTAYMVPTEILAKQHFQNFISFFKHININIALITSSGCYKFPSKTDPARETKISRSQLLKWVEDGKIPIVIGTHSLIQKSVKFKNLGLVIIDEQHRFGTNQRQNLARKDEFAPHLLSMTATPIPRTLALTIYGDLDLTLLSQMPTGRKPIITELVLPNEREKTYMEIRKEIKDGRQAYVICPRIDEPDPDKQTALNVKSVKAEARRLKRDVFQNYKIDILHSKMKPAEKDKVMKKFEDGETDILCATSVVEVGVNVPNATVIIIEGAERFGLAQLHQLRGRVIRSNHQAYAYIFSDTKSNKSIERLKALQTARDGFQLSEFDLQFRGSGELSGTKQWGISDLGMEAIKNIKMVEAARDEASRIVFDDSSLKKYPQILAKIDTKKEIHFE